jgi:hypothetical protein
MLASGASCELVLVRSFRLKLRRIGDALKGPSMPRLNQEQIVFLLWIALFATFAVALPGFLSYGNIITLILASPFSEFSP